MGNSPTTFNEPCGLHARCAESGDRLAGPGPVTFSLLRDRIGMGQSSITFHELYSRYAGDVYRFAHWLSGNPHDAQDITAETFVRAWTAPEEPRLESVKAYLFTIARNLHRKQWRRASRHEVLDEAMPDPATRPDKAAANREEFQRTLAAVHALPEMDRTVLLLRAEDDLSYQDIAAVTGLSVTAAKVKVFRARAKLAALLQPETERKS
ncbi:MAG TPA: sigma-70 family RNA polymerase sigma factor [Chthoniobacterales bacterium]